MSIDRRKKDPKINPYFQELINEEIQEMISKNTRIRDQEFDIE